MGYHLSGSHRSTRIASDLASRALASQAKPQRESKSQAFRIAILKNTLIFRIAGQHRRIFAGFFSCISCDFRSSECVFASLAKKTFSHRWRFGGVRFESHRTSRLHRAIWATKGITLILGGRPEKIFSPPPQKIFPNSLQTPSRPAPSPSCRPNPPPGTFNKKTDLPPRPLPALRTPPSPSLTREKNKKYPKYAHQGLYRSIATWRRHEGVPSICQGFLWHLLGFEFLGVCVFRTVSSMLP